MTVLITGASGLIGGHTVALLQARGEGVRTFQRSVPPMQPGVEHIQGDVRTDLEALCAATRGCRAVVHLAGRGDVGESRRDPLGYAELNATGALNTLEAARAAGATFLLASTQRVYPLQPALCREDALLAPDSPYGYAKWVAELWCRMASEQFGLTTRCLRFFSVYGPGQQPNGGSGVVTIFARAALTGTPLRIQSAGRRDFSSAHDVARGIGLALDLPPDGAHRVYNVATGVGTTFRDLAEMVLEIAGSRSPIEESVAEPPGKDLVADIGRAEAELGYQPCIGLREGLETYLKWLRSSV
jgi:nucleoside-diphosphate-sugar epimerase